MMDKKKLLAGAALVTLSSVMPQVAQAVTGAGTIDAVILQPIAVSDLTNMDFGTFSYSAAGTIALDSQDTATPSAAINYLTASTESSGRFQITASNGQNVVITANTAIATLTHATLADTMKVSSFVFRCTAAKWGGDTAADVATATCALGGTNTTGNVDVGGTLTVAGTESAGVYQGTYTINASYP